MAASTGVSVAALSWPTASPRPPLRAPREAWPRRMNQSGESGGSRQSAGPAELRRRTARGGTRARAHASHRACSRSHKPATLARTRRTPPLLAAELSAWCKAAGGRALRRLPLRPREPPRRRPLSSITFPTQRSCARGGRTPQARRSSVAAHRRWSWRALRAWPAASSSS